jgi:hypothetical protein
MMKKTANPAASFEREAVNEAHSGPRKQLAYLSSVEKHVYGQ